MWQGHQTQPEMSRESFLEEARSALKLERWIGVKAAKEVSTVCLKSGK